LGRTSHGIPGQSTSYLDLERGYQRHWYNVYRTVAGGARQTELLVANIQGTSYTDNIPDNQLRNQTPNFSPGGIAECLEAILPSRLPQVQTRLIHVLLRQTTKDSTACSAQTWGVTFDSEWADDVSSGLMHELGHTLGLMHGGSDPYSNYKSNYLSIMNYSYDYNRGGTASFNFGSLPGCKINNSSTSIECRTMRPLDYSRKALPSLTENALFEPLGIAGPAGYRVLWYVPDGAGDFDSIIGAADPTARLEPRW